MNQNQEQTNINEERVPGEMQLGGRYLFYVKPRELWDDMWTRRKRKGEEFSEEFDRQESTQETDALHMVEPNRQIEH